MIEILKAIVFGIVEGITEWLPISSTGHMILLNQIMPLEESGSFYSMFQVVIQLGAILAVVVLFWNKIWPFGHKNNKYPFSKTGVGSYVKKDIFVLWIHILVSCIPAAVVGLLFDDQLEEWFYNYQTVSVMLIIVGILFLVVESFHSGRRAVITSVRKINYKVAVLIGIFQLIAAIFPGTSRSGATIIGALILGVSRTVAAEYTFYLAIPVMFGASLLKLVKFGFDFTAIEVGVLLTGLIVAFVVSLAVIRFLMDYIRKHDFKIFGWYRIAIGVIVLVCGFAGLFE